MLKEYKEISQEDLEKARANAWSIQNMAAHDAAGRSVRYIGSTMSEHRGEIIEDYYIDDAGAYWFDQRAIVNNQIVSMEVYIFGRDLKKKKKYSDYR